MEVRVGFKSLCFLGLLQCMIERKIKRLVKRKKMVVLRACVG